MLVLFTASVALLADTVHIFGDALTAVPLWIAFVLAVESRTAATCTATAGPMTSPACSSCSSSRCRPSSPGGGGREATDRFIHPRPIENPWLLVAAGIIGFRGNEAVAVHRIGWRIGSAALVVDGMHARLVGFTSLSVVLGAIAVLVGLLLADPIIGLLIANSIVMLL